MLHEILILTIKPQILESSTLFVYMKYYSKYKLTNRYESCKLLLLFHLKRYENLIIIPIEAQFQALILSHHFTLTVLQNWPPCIDIYMHVPFNREFLAQIETLIFFLNNLIFVVLSCSRLWVFREFSIFEAVTCMWCHRFIQRSTSRTPIDCNHIHIHSPP